MIVVYGSSFDPPTTAHCEIVRLLSQMAERVLVVPSGDGRWDKKFFLQFEQRLQLLQAMLNEVNLPNVIVDERERTGFLCTADLMDSLELEYPLRSTYFAIGEDCLQALPSWRRSSDILAKCKFIVVTRDCPKDRLSEKSEFLVHQTLKLDDRLMKLSSSNVRAKIAVNDASWTEDVCESVAGLINRNDYYNFVNRPAMTEPVEPVEPVDYNLNSHK